MATLSVVVPALTSRRRSGRSSTLSAPRRSPTRKIIVVDDGSTDGTRELLEGELRAKVDTLVVHDKNRGKGAALRSGFEAATGDIILVQDATSNTIPKTTYS